jgi:hypothetical protein
MIDRSGCTGWIRQRDHPPVWTKDLHTLRAFLSRLRPPLPPYFPKDRLRGRVRCAQPERPGPTRTRRLSAQVGVNVSSAGAWRTSDGGPFAEAIARQGPETLRGDACRDAWCKGKFEHNTSVCEIESAYRSEVTSLRNMSIFARNQRLRKSVGRRRDENLPDAYVIRVGQSLSHNSVAGCWVKALKHDLIIHFSVQFFAFLHALRSPVVLAYITLQLLLYTVHDNPL